MSEPVVSRKTYAIVCAVLLVLTGTTTGVAYIDMGGVWNFIVAITIGVAKSLLVVLFFMHLRYSGRLLWVFAGAGIFWFILMVGGTLHDVSTRPQATPTGVSQKTEIPTERSSSTP